jgi:hypothetical protein
LRPLLSHALRRHALRSRPRRSTGSRRPSLRRHPLGRRALLGAGAGRSRSGAGGARRPHSRSPRTRWHRRRGVDLLLARNAHVDDVVQLGQHPLGG